MNILNRKLEQALGNEVIATPSGAGPAMLILSKDQAVVIRARKEAERIYQKEFKSPASAFDTPFY